VRIAAHVLGRRPTGRAARRPARARSAASAEPCMISGSADDVATVMRGFSEAYGSWKMICMSPAQRAQRARQCRDVAGPRTGPRRRWARSGAAPAAGGGLAAADSPTSPASRRRAMSKLTPSTACTWPTVREACPALTGKCLTRSSPPAAARAITGHGQRPPSVPRSSRRLPAGHLVAGRPASRSGGCAAAVRVGERAARREAAAGGRRGRAGHAALDGRPGARRHRRARGIEPSRPCV
jgi:hypothetical protein